MRAASSLALAFSSLETRDCVFCDMIPPPQCLRICGSNEHTRNNNRIRGTCLVVTVVVVGLHGLDKLGKSGLILLGHGGDGQSSGGLLVDDGSETRLALQISAFSNNYKRMTSTIHALMMQYGTSSLRQRAGSQTTI